MFFIDMCHLEGSDGPNSIPSNLSN